MKKKILNKIEELVKEKFNFIDCDYDMEEEYFESFDEITARRTLTEFAEWLIKETK